MKNDKDMFPDKTVEEITEDDNIVSCTSKCNPKETKEDYVEASTDIFGYVEEPPTFNCPQRKDVEVTNNWSKPTTTMRNPSSWIFHLFMRCLLMSMIRLMAFSRWCR